MLDVEFYISSLIHKRLKEEITEAEQLELDKWLDESPANHNFYLHILDQDKFQEEFSIYSKTNTANIWRLISENLEAEAKIVPVKKYTLFSNWYAYVGAIAAILLVVFVALFYSKNRLLDRELSATGITNIEPGKIGATLTLGDGRKINLSDASDGQLAEQSGVTIRKSHDGELIYEIKGNGLDYNNTNTLSTANGETYQVKLPDGTKVWLNSGSSLEYPSRFDGLNKRIVKLNGEAYFEVSKNKEKQFIVMSPNQKVTVLGTHFNIRSYSDEVEIKTTLVEGSVQVDVGGENFILSPNHQSVLNLQKGRVHVSPVDSEIEIAWKNGVFIFKDESLQSILNKVSKWYDVEIVYDQNANKEASFGGVISRYENISEVLKVLEATGKVHFKIIGRRVVVTK